MNLKHISIGNGVIKPMTNKDAQREDAACEESFRRWYGNPDPHSIQFMLFQSGWNQALLYLMAGRVELPPEDYVPIKCKCTVE